MVKRHLPSIEALISNDDDLLREELRLSEVCEELAVARAFLDHVERMVGYRTRQGAANDAEPTAATRALG
jgi:hypothetical protein